MKENLTFSVTDDKKLLGIKNGALGYGRFTYNRETKQNNIYINKKFFKHKQLNKFIDIMFHEYTHFILTMLLRNKMLCWNEEQLQERICQAVEVEVAKTFNTIVGGNKQ